MVRWKKKSVIVGVKKIGDMSRWKRKKTYSEMIGVRKKRAQKG